MLVRSTSPSESSLWLVDLARGGATPLSSGRGRNDTPVWSPDGTRVVWARDRDGAQNLFVKRVDDRSSRSSCSFESDVPFKNPVDWSRDGQWIVMTQLDPDTSQNVWLLDASGTKPPTAIVRGPLRDNGGAGVPGRPLDRVTRRRTAAGSRSTSSRFPRPAARCRSRRTVRCGAWWTRDGRQLVLLGGDSADAVARGSQPGETLGVGTPKQFATSARRHRVASTRCQTGSDSSRLRRSARAPGRSPSCRTGAPRWPEHAEPQLIAQQARTTRSGCHRDPRSGFACRQGPSPCRSENGGRLSSASR